LANNPEGDVLQVTLPATSIFGKEDGGKRPLQAYARYMAAQTPPVNLDTIVTRMKFDTKAESPKLVFEASRWLTDDEYTAAQDQAHSSDAAKAVAATPAALDGVVAPVAPLKIEGTRPMGDLTKEEDAPAYEPIAEKAAKKTKAKAAPVDEDETDEPEVRQAAAPKPTAVPAKKSKLAGIVSDWDDE
jgi:hypothetical protein